MDRLLRQLIQTRLSPGRITGVYVIVGGLWIILSSFWASTHTAGLERFLHFEIIKGLSFVAFTAVLLWFLCRSWSRQIRKAVKAEEHTLLKYETYVMNSPISISVIDKKGRFLDANKATEALTGYRSEELKSKTIFDLDRTISTRETANVFAEIFETGHAVQERVIQRKDGTHIDVKVHGIRYDEDQAICFSNDITGRIQNERKLLMLNAMLRAIRRMNKVIVDATEVEDLIRKICEVLVQDRDFKHAWIALLDSEGKPVHYSDAPALLDAGRLKTFLDEGKLEACLADTRAEDGLVVAKDPASECLEFPIMRGLEGCALLGMHFTYDSHEGYIALMAHPEVLNAEEISLFREVCGDLRYALHTIRIETEKTQALKDLLEAKQAAEDANKAKDDFLAVMSHELRTPLNPIIGFSGMLLEEATTESVKGYAETILKAGQRQLNLVDEILHYMRLQRGNVEVTPENFCLVELCESVIHDVSTSTNASGLDLRLTNGAKGKPVPPDLEAISDEQIIRSILDNLIGNACKYTTEGHVALDLSESATAPGEFVFTVEDTGIGIKHEDRDKLFQAFHQADNSYTRAHDGIGLGLAICKKLADLIEGTISLTTAPGRGSTFALRLPLPVEDAQESVSDQGVRTPALRKFDRALEILIVDDKPDNGFVIEKMLTHAGGRADRAEDGAVAVELCGRHRYDVILMDLAMPVMNGLEASQAIGNEGLNTETPIIAVTADATPAIHSQCEKAGMRALLTKPIKTDDLIDIIWRNLS